MIENSIYKNQGVTIIYGNSNKVTKIELCK